MQESTQSLYVTGLVNARALETQAIELLSRQVERLENYPEMEAALRAHIKESEAQRGRLDEILSSMGESNSSVKDFVTGLMGNMAALAHAPMQDEVLKNHMANYAFEHFEIASYKSLLVFADMVGDTKSPTALTQSLREEERMAQWVEDNIDATVRTFATRAAQGLKAGV